jgi:hypothetical protein
MSMCQYCGEHRSRCTCPPALLPDATPANADWIKRPYGRRYIALKRDLMKAVQEATQVANRRITITTKAGGGFDLDVAIDLAHLNRRTGP